MPDEVHNLRVEAVDERLAGRATLGRRRVLRIPGALPGELVRLRVERRGRGGRPDLAKLEQIWEAHADRRTPFCPRHADRNIGVGCTGCSLQHATWGLQRRMKRDWLKQVFGLEVEEVEVGADEVGYRHVSKRVVGGAEGALILGSYVRGTHAVASMAGCEVEHPLIRACADELVEVGNAARVCPWDEATGSGDLRFVWMKTNGREVLTTLVTGPEGGDMARSLSARLSRSQSVAWSVQGSKGNQMRGDTCEVLRGTGTLSMSVGGGEVTYGPLGFMQPNPEVAARAMDALVEGEGGAPATGSLAWDLYAGGGATTRRLQQSFETVEACDVQVEASSTELVEEVDVGEFLAKRAAGPAPDVLLANPPRGGMGPSVCGQIKAQAPASIHIMSCNPKSLRRDLDALLEGGRYELRAVRAFDTLPHTEHVELVVRLSRVGS